MYAFSIHPQALLVAAVVSYAIGIVWYSPAGFFRPWARITGITAETQLKKGRLVRYVNYGLIFIALLAIALVTSFFLNNLFVPSVSQALVVGFWLWFVGVGIVTMVTTITQSSLDTRVGDSWKLFAINTGYWLIVFLITALIIFSMS